MQVGDNQNNKIDWTNKEVVKDYHKQYYNKQKEENNYTDCKCGKKYLNICKEQHFKSKQHQMYLRIKYELLQKVNDIKHKLLNDFVFEL